MPGRLTTAIIAVIAACLPGVPSDAGEAPASPTPEALLWDVRQAHRQGDFEAAWTSYLAFFRHPDRHNVDFSIYGICFSGAGQCPSVPSLGAFLGKSRQAFAALDNFCPDWPRMEQEVRAEYPEPEDMTTFLWAKETMLKSTLGDCAQWRADTLSTLHPQTRQAAPLSRQVLRLKLPDTRSGAYYRIVRYIRQLVWFFHREMMTLKLVETGPNNYYPDHPTVQVRIGAESARLIPDTGSSNIAFCGGEAMHRRFALDELKTIRMDLTRTPRGSEYFARSSLPSLWLGNAEFRDTQTSVCQPDNPVVQAGGEFMTLGMTILLRYDSVCFAWKEARLYLGALGPCAAGRQPHKAFLTGPFGIALEVQAETGAPTAPLEDQPQGGRGESIDDWKTHPLAHLVKIDTGAFKNYCSRDFIAAMGGDYRFAFGDDDLTADCFRELDRWVFREDARERGAYTAVLGMDGLLQFDAFGWELNPLKVYFVPKTSGGETTAKSPPANGSQTAEAHARRS